MINIGVVRIETGLERAPIGDSVDCAAGIAIVQQVLRLVTNIARFEQAAERRALGDGEAIAIRKGSPVAVPVDRLNPDWRALNIQCGQFGKCIDAVDGGALNTGRGVQSLQ